MEKGITNLDDLFGLLEEEPEQDTFEELQGNTPVEIALNKLRNKQSVIEEILRMGRIIVTKNSNQFKFGDIVIDEKNNEFGIVLCEKPVGMTDRSPLGKTTTPRKKSLPTYILLTLTNEDNFLNFRVRYTNEIWIKLFEGNNLPKKNSISDLEKFCEACILECSTVCPLYKYTRKVDGAKY